VKSMRTSPTRQRSGIATRLLEHIITEARRMGISRLSLETGTDEFFAPARRLYETFAFTYCDPFADYKAGPHNTFMTRPV
jgi:putative acetyltransferase